MTVIAGTFKYFDTRQGWYRAERHDTGAIWVVEIVTLEGLCYDTIKFPQDVDANKVAKTDEGARQIIAGLLRDRHGAYDAS